VVARKVISALQARFAEWKKTLKIKQVSEPKRLAKPLTIYKPAESEQLHIFVGHLGIRRDDRDFYALELLECILGGAPGCVDRLGMMLYREKRVVRRIFCELSKDLVLQPGVFMVYASTSSEKGPTAREAIFREIQKLREDGVTEEELADAKRYLIRSFLLKSGSVEELAESLIKMERFNLGVDFWERYPGLLRELTKDDLIRVARNYLDTNNYVMVVVGPVDEKGKPVPPKK
jgi:zinc protease